MNQFKKTQLFVFILFLVGIVQSILAKDQEDDFFKKNNLQLIIPEECSRTANIAAPRFQCLSCDSDICKAATEMYIFYANGSVEALKGDFSKKEKLFKVDESAGTPFQEHEGSIFEKKKTVREKFNGAEPNGLSFVIVGKNIKTMLPQISYISFQKIGEKKYDTDKPQGEQFSCKPDTGYRTVSYEVLKSPVNGKIYYNQWVQKKIGSNKSKDNNLYIHSSGVLKNSNTCTEWHRTTSSDDDYLLLQGSTGILRIHGILKLDKDFFVADDYVFNNEQGYSSLEQISNDETKLIPIIKG